MLVYLKLNSLFHKEHRNIRFGNMGHDIKGFRVYHIIPLIFQKPFNRCFGLFGEVPYDEKRYKRKERFKDISELPGVLRPFTEIDLMTV